MPTYTFFNEESGIEWEEFLSFSEKDLLLASNSKIVQLAPTQVNIVRGTGGLRNDDGWKENLSRIAEAHPTSALAQTHGDKSVKDTKTRQAVEKWRNKRKAAGD